MMRILASAPLAYGVPDFGLLGAFRVEVAWLRAQGLRIALPACLQGRRQGATRLVGSGVRTFGLGILTGC